MVCGNSTPTCVILIIWDNPPPDTEIFANLSKPEPFAETDAMNDPLPDPAKPDIVSQGWLEIDIQDTFPETVSV